MLVRFFTHHYILQLFTRRFWQCYVLYTLAKYDLSASSLFSQPSPPSPQQVEDAYDGQICRCTGYRAILDAAQTLQQQQPLADIEVIKGQVHKSIFGQGYLEPPVSTMNLWCRLCCGWHSGIIGVQTTLMHCSVMA